MNIYKASFDTENFEFTAYSDTRNGAVEILKSTFTNHIKKTGGWYTWADVKEDVYIEEIPLNTGYVR